MFMKNFSRRLTFWILLPLSAVQGLWLRYTATRLPEATGARSGVCGHGAELRLLALGDSIIAGVGTGSMEHSLPVQFANALASLRKCSVQWRVMGANGADISDLRSSIKLLSHQQQVDVIMISIGVNDVTGLSSTRRWRFQVNQLVSELALKWPKARVMFAGLPPMGQFPLLPQPLRFTLGLRASPLDAFFSVALPLSARGYVTAAVLAFAHTLGEFGVLLMVGGNIPGETRVMSIAIFEHVEMLNYTAAHQLAAGGVVVE